MRSILITGGSGFFGSHLVLRFLNNGYDVYTPGSITMDLMDLESICRFIQRHEKPEAIIHSAAYYGGLGINQEQPADMLFINTIMAANVWEAAARMGIPYVMSIGSACAYPGGLVGDYKEDGLEVGPCHESVEGYGMTKRIHRVFQRQYGKQHGIFGCQPVLTNLYGPKDDFSLYRSHVVAALIDRFAKSARDKLPKVTCWGDGSPIREFIYVRDAAEAVYQLYEKRETLKDPHGVYNVGTGIGTSIKELTEVVAEATGYTGEIEWDTDKPNGAMRKVLDSTKIRDELGWKPTTSLQDGIRETVAWHRSMYM